MKVKNFELLPKRKVTVDEILQTDDITDLLRDLYEKRCEIDQFILIYTDKNSEIHVNYQGNRERLVYALEKTKLKILLPSEEDGE